MVDKFVVFNPTHSNVSFQVGLPFDKEQVMQMAQHHQRKIVRSAFVNVNIKPQSSVDLVVLTGLTSEQLMVDTEVSRNLRFRTLVHLKAELPVTQAPKVMSPVPVKVVEAIKPIPVKDIPVPVKSMPKVVLPPMPPIPMPVVPEVVPEPVVEKTKKPGLFSKFGKGKA